MRLRRLALTRFGRFTDHQIDFAAPRDGVDLHVVYGGNETGKSTLREAWLAFLFGIPARTPYNFLHSYDALEIGAVLDLAARELDAVRVKKARESLRSPQTHLAVAELPLQEALAGVDRDAYKQLFCLDGETLTGGGDDILRAKGDLGALLFAGASGASRVADTLEQTRDEASAFHKPWGKKTELAAQLKRLAEIKSELAEIDVSASEYSRRRDANVEALRHHSELVEKRSEKAATSRRRKALLDALRPWQDLQREEEALTLLGEMPTATTDDLVTARRARDEREPIFDRIERATERLHKIDHTLEQCALPVHAADLASGLDAIRSVDLEARARTARLDLPKRESELADVQAERHRLLEELGRADEANARSLLLTGVATDHVRELIESVTALEENVRRARDEARTAEDEVNLARRQASAFRSEGPPGALRDVLQSVRDVLTSERGAELAAAAYDATIELEKARDALAPWVGNSKSLSTLAVPSPPDLEALGRKADDTARELTAASEDLRRRSEEADQLEAILAADVSEAGLISDEDAGRLRAARDAAWDDHVASLKNSDSRDTQQTADRFKKALRADDAATTQRIARAGDLERSRSLTRRLAEARADEDSAQRRYEAAKAMSEASIAQLHQVATGLGLPAETSLPTVADWLRRREAAIAANKAVQTAVGAKERHDTTARTAADELKAALRTAGYAEDGSPRVLVLRAQEAVDQGARLEERSLQAAEALQRALHRAERRREAVTSAEAEVANLSERLRAEMQPIGFPNATAHVAKTIIGGLDKLRAALDREDDLRRRIEAMQADQRAFESRVQALAERVGFKPDDDALAQFESLAREEQNIRDRATTLRNYEQERDRTQQEIEGAQANLEKLDEDAKRLATRFNAGSLDEVVEIIEHSLKATERRERIHGHVQTLSGIFDGASRANWEGEVENLAGDPDAAARARALHDAEQSELAAEEDEVGAAYAEVISTQRALDMVGSSDDAAQLEQERATILAEIEEGANEHLRLVAGEMMVSEALRAFRDEHRSTMMSAASEAFVRMTRGSFSGLTSVAAEGGETLVAQRPSGTIGIDAMSLGTRTQLYLALRIAGHAEFAAQRTPLPFVADDILEAFDDDRAFETFRLLTEMAKKGQVIYLTHHQHLIDVAKKASDGRLQVHELPQAVQRRGDDRAP